MRKERHGQIAAAKISETDGQIQGISANQNRDV